MPGRKATWYQWLASHPEEDNYASIPRSSKRGQEQRESSENRANERNRGFWVGNRGRMEKAWKSELSCRNWYSYLALFCTECLQSHLSFNMYQSV